MFNYLEGSAGGSAIISGDTAVLLLGETLSPERLNHVRSLMRTASFTELVAALRDPHGLALTNFALCDLRGGSVGEAAVAVGGSFSSLSNGHEREAEHVSGAVGVPAQLAPPTGADAGPPASADAESPAPAAPAEAAETETPAATAPSSPFDQLFERTQYFGVEAAAVRNLDASEGPAKLAAPSLSLTFADGNRVGLERPVLIGRKPVAPSGGDGVEFTLCKISDRKSGLSRTHARVDPADGSASVTDLGSTNGTSIIRSAGDTIALAPHEPQRVFPGDRIQLSDTVIVTVAEG